MLTHQFSFFRIYANCGPWVDILFLLMIAVLEIQLFAQVHKQNSGMRYALFEVHLRCILYNATCFVQSASRAPPLVFKMVSDIP